MPYKPEAAIQRGEMVWNVKCQVPPNHVLRVQFMRYENGVAVAEPGLGACLRSGGTALEQTLSWRVAPGGFAPSKAGSSDQWELNAGKGSQRIRLPAMTRLNQQAPFGIFSLRPSQQRSLTLVRSLGPGEADSNSRPTVELQFSLEPLDLTAVQS